MAAMTTAAKAAKALVQARTIFRDGGRRIELYYDVISPYSFVAFEKTWNADLQLRPFLLGGVFKACGNVPPATVRAKGINMTHDLRRINECCAIPVQAPKDINRLFSGGSIAAQRLLTAISMQAPEHLHAVTEQLFLRSWSNDQDITEPGSLLEACDAAGVAADEAQKLLAATADDAVKERLKAVTAEAVERGAFGAPTIVAGGELYFGSDRFELIAHRIGERYYGSSANPYAQDIQDLLEGNSKL